MLQCGLDTCALAFNSAKKGQRSTGGRRARGCCCIPHHSRTYKCWTSYLLVGRERSSAGGSSKLHRSPPQDKLLKSQTCRTHEPPGISASNQRPAILGARSPPDSCQTPFPPEDPKKKQPTSKQERESCMLSQYRASWQAVRVSVPRRSQTTVCAHPCRTCSVFAMIQAITHHFIHQAHARLFRVMDTLPVLHSISSPEVLTTRTSTLSDFTNTTSTSCTQCTIRKHNFH
jgi:hypothetical protein